MSDAEMVLTPFVWRRPVGGVAGAVSWVDDGFIDPSPMSDDCRGQYGIDRGEKLEKRWLFAPHRSSEWEKYQPLADNPELFRTFMDVEATEAGYLAFAQQYGTLGVQSTLDRSKDQSGFFGFGEALYLWRKEQAFLRAAHRVVNAVAKRRMTELDSWFVLTPKQGYRVAGELIAAEFMPGGPHALVRPAFGNMPLPAVWQAIDAERKRTNKVLLVARVWLARQVNKRIQGLQGDTSSVSVRIVALGGGPILPIHFSPNSLLAAMWLQFVEAANGNRKFKRCKNCQRWFLLSPEGVGKKRQAQYHSDNCRLRAWRKSNSSRRAGPDEEEPRPR